MTVMLPADAALPQLARALDGAAMAAVFAPLISPNTVLACEVDRVKYRPRGDSSNCSVSYRLRLNDVHGREVEQIVATRWCAAGDAERRFRRALARATTRSAAGPSVSHVAALNMVAHWLPNDAKLDAAAIVFDDRAMRERWLPEVVALLTQGHGRLLGHRSTLVQFVPELRLCARVDLHLQDEPQAAARTVTVYAKADHEYAGSRTQAAMRALADSRAQAEGRLRTATPLLWQPGSGLHWQHEVPGRALAESQHHISAGMSARVGNHLAVLHVTPVDGLEPLSVDKLRQRLHNTAALLCGVDASWAPLLESITKRLDSQADALAAQPVVTLHGDLHAHNILVDGTRLAFIDLDSMREGPAVVELGGWIADALHGAMLDGLPLAQTVPAWRALLRAYIERTYAERTDAATTRGSQAQAQARARVQAQPRAQPSHHPVDAALLAWATAHALVCTRAYRAVANLKGGRLATVPALLALAETIVRSGSIEASLALGKPRRAVTPAWMTTAFTPSPQP